MLFNDTILMNIRYGRLDATDEEVFAAAEAACIHEAITTRFPKVGARWARWGRRAPGAASRLWRAEE